MEKYYAMIHLYTIFYKPVISLILFNVIALASLASTGAIKGKVTDGSSGEALPFANVVIIVKKKTIGAQTDLNGYYSIESVPAGIHKVEVSYIGFVTAVVNKVVVEPNKTTTLNIEMNANGEMLDEVVLIGGRSSSITQNKTATGKVVSREDIYNLPNRNLNSIAATPAGKLDKEKSSTNIKGSRANATDYFINGIKVINKTKEAVESETINKQEQPRAGRLTAGEIHDFSKWKLWNDLSENELSEYKDIWSIYPNERYTIQAVTEDGFPIVDATVSLNINGKTIWTAKTDNTGKAELWNILFEKEQSKNKKNTNVNAAINYKGTLNELTQLKKFEDGINIITLKEACAYAKNLDIAFVVDATGSMGDEIDFLKIELLDVIDRVQTEFKELNINLGNVFYRDKAEAYLTKNSPLTNNIKNGIAFIKEQKAGGGGDFPEAVDVGLEEAVNQLQWSEKAVARILFLVLDAPPHQNETVNKKLQATITNAAQKGIRIVPIVGSGIDKSTEYLLRSFALATNGHYLFLTDHSGIGGTHLKPSTDSYDVKNLNDLLVDIIIRYANLQNCDAKAESIIIEEKLEQETVLEASINIFPNPNDGRFSVETSADIEELFITDANGKILIRFTDFVTGQNQVDIANFPTGMYFVRYELAGKIVTKKVVKR